MRLTRLFVDIPLSPGSLIDLPKETAAHVAKVLRARSGDAVILFNGDGREVAGVIEEVRGARVSVAAGESRAVDRESPLAITLVQCVPRGDRMDFVVQKATELGVVRIVPVVSQRSVVRLDESQAASKAAHWHAVAISACEQCGRNRLPQVEPPQPLLNYLGDSEPQGTRLVLEPESAAATVPTIEAHVEIAIGPEGGFAPDELDALRLAGFSAVSFGPRILRTETAAIAAAAWLQSRFGDLR